MKPNPRLSYPDNVKIQEIIDSFRKYAIRDIRVNIENPIAAFILISCLIDQMAAYAYNTPKFKNGECYRQFITDYFEHREPLELYTNLRCSLVHNYSISENFRLSSEPVATDTPGYISVNNLSVTGFLKEIEIAFNKFSNDLLNNYTVKKNALDRYLKYPPIVGVYGDSHLYTENEASFLVSYYTTIKNIIGQPLNGNIQMPITLIQKQPLQHGFIVKCIYQNGAAIYESNLDEITRQLGVEYPIDVLKEAGQYEEGSPAPLSK